MLILTIDANYSICSPEVKKKVKKYMKCMKSNNKLQSNVLATEDAHRLNSEINTEINLCIITINVMYLNSFNR